MLSCTILNFKIFNLFYYFAIYALLGWIMESIYASFKRKRFVNRGFLNGPFCPIYGFGLVILIVLLNPVMNNIPILFLCSMVLTSALEYLTGFILEKAFGTTWWDYSKRRFNIKGRVCLRFSIYWGILSVFILKIIHPAVKSFVNGIPAFGGIILAYIMFAYFLVDFIFTLNSVISLNSLMKDMYRISIQIRSQLDEIKETTALRFEDVEAVLKEYRKKYELLLEKNALRHRRIIRAFPGLTSLKFDRILGDIRNRIEENIKSRISKY